MHPGAGKRVRQRNARPPHGVLRASRPPLRYPGYLPLSQSIWTRNQDPVCHTLGCSILELLYRNVQRFRGGLVFKAHRLLYHSTLGLRVIKKKRSMAHPTANDKSCVYRLLALVTGTASSSTTLGTTAVSNCQLLEYKAVNTVLIRQHLALA